MLSPQLTFEENPRPRPCHGSYNIIRQRTGKKAASRIVYGSYDILLGKEAKNRFTDRARPRHGSYSKELNIYDTSKVLVATRIYFSHFSSHYFYIKINCCIFILVGSRRSSTQIKHE